MKRPKTNPATVRELRLERLLRAERDRRERAERAAREWQDRFRLFLDHAPMPAFIRDEQGLHIYGNKPRHAWASAHAPPKCTGPNCCGGSA